MTSSHRADGGAGSPLLTARRSNFYYSLLLLPKEKREALMSVYEFFRAADDAVDEPGDPADKRRRLREFSEEFEASLNGEPASGVFSAVKTVIERFGIPVEPFRDLLAGMEMDLTKHRYETFQELQEYCYRAASTVGLVSIAVFGYRTEEAKEYAVNLGKALQLTNIIRDVALDAQEGRIYIPQEDLVRFRCPEEDLLQRKLSEEFRRLMRFECERARGFFESARAHLTPEDEPFMTAARVMEAIYEGILRKIECHRYDVFTERISLSPVSRGIIALGAYLKNEFSRLR
ncbi:MAG: squalene synthase HpnD [Ignavibacteriales bacterium CG07_land_8_20_14_0_80_59_12]|nr:MAG: squalene synthase HpnD [Ignavibacteriales bacterium CG07_land_8_20_14_0_80_59_12]